MIANQPLDGQRPQVTLRSLLSRNGMMLGLVKFPRNLFGVVGYFACRILSKWLVATRDGFRICG